jgi:hypothetical protein
MSQPAPERSDEQIVRGLTQDTYYAVDDRLI